jgi:hypothetical protein
VWYSTAPSKYQVSHCHHHLHSRRHCGVSISAAAPKRECNSTTTTAAVSTTAAAA